MLNAKLLYSNGHVVLPALPEIIKQLPADLSRKTKRVVAKGKSYVALPHTPSHAIALRKLGVNAALPVHKSRDFPLHKNGKALDPFKHQIATMKFLIEHPRAFVLNEAGLGKTASAIWAWHYLFKAGAAGRCVVFCPKTIMRSAWIGDLFSTIPQVSVGLVAGDKKVRDKILQGPFQVLIVNHDGILHNDALRKDLGITHVIIDEAAAFNRHDSQRSKAMRKFVKGKSCWAMTATPISHSPDRAWALAQLVDPTTVGSNFFEFRETVMRKPYRTAMHYVPRDRSVWEPIVTKALSPAIRFTKDDCLDLPPQTVAPDREVALTAEQQQFADAMVKDWVFEDAQASAPISAVNAAARLSKLMQCYQGAVRRDDGTIQYFDYGPRFDAVTEIIDEAEGKVLILAQFVAPLRRLVQDLNAHYKKKSNGGDGTTDVAVGMAGATSTSARAEIVKRFQDPNDPLRVIVGHPETVSHGLTLTQGSAIIWFGPYFKAENYAQANERLRRPGQVRNTTVHHIVSSEAERATFAGLQDRLKVQDIALSAYRQAVS